MNIAGNMIFDFAAAGERYGWVKGGKELDVERLMK